MHAIHAGVHNLCLCFIWPDHVFRLDQSQQHIRKEDEEFDCRRSVNNIDKATLQISAHFSEADCIETAPNDRETSSITIDGSDLLSSWVSHWCAVV